jgi:hypothetical protein
VKPRLIALAIIVLYGIIRMPIEANLSREQKKLHYHGAALNIDMRQRLGQDAFIAALSGFRALVADSLWLQAHSVWQRTEWGKLKVLLDTITALQPRNVMFWDMAGWHMAYNASVAAREDQSQPREALRLRAEREYWKLGEDFLLRGIQNNPTGRSFSRTSRQSTATSSRITRRQRGPTTRRRSVPTANNTSIDSPSTSSRRSPVANAKLTSG